MSSGCGVRVLDWTIEELKSIDINTRKLLTMNGSLDQRGKEIFIDCILEEQKEEEGL